MSAIEYIFTDVDMSMGLNIKNDIAKVCDINAIKQSVKNIVLTRDRLFYPSWGPRISHMLFELNNPFNQELVTDEIKMAITKYEPRVKNVKVEYLNDPNDDNNVNINIIFQVINSMEYTNVDILVEKLR